MVVSLSAAYLPILSCAFLSPMQQERLVVGVNSWLTATNHWASSAATDDGDDDDDDDYDYDYDVDIMGRKWVKRDICCSCDVTLRCSATLLHLLLPYPYPFLILWACPFPLPHSTPAAFPHVSRGPGERKLLV